MEGGTKMRREQVMIRQLPYEFVCDYKEDEHLRESFFKLAREVFNIDFKPWYEMGEWQEKYIPFSIVVKGEVVANASVNFCYFKKGERSACYIQIGTVMTRADHRQKGLSGFLINKIIETYQEEQENIYLYANDTVLNFYPKFGFSKVDLYQFYKQVNKAYLSEKEEQLTFRQLDHRKIEDRSLLSKKIKEGASKEEALSTIDNESLLMFYFQGFMSQCFYYVQEADSIVVMAQEENKMIIHEIYGDLSLMHLEKALLKKNINEIVLGFMPKGSAFEVRKSEEADTTLFVLDVNKYHEFTGEYGYFPTMSYA